MLAKRWETRLLHALEEVRVVADLAQLHEDVQIDLFIVLLEAALGQEVTVELDLYLCESDEQVDLLLRREATLDFELSSAQKEGLEDLVHLLDERHVELLAVAALDC